MVSRRVVREPGERGPNPFVPGFNQVPDELAGRGDFFAGLGEALEEAAYDGRTPRPLTLTGPRGVGKTVLLTEAHRVAAEELGWIGVHHEIVVDRRFIDELAGSLVEVARLYREEPPKRPRRAVVTGASVGGGAFGVQAGLEVTRVPEQETPTTLGASLDGAAMAALERSAGLIVTLDELQYGERSELQQVGSALQARVPKGWPIVVIVAGLPSIQDPQRIPTYFERGEWHHLGALDEASTLAALEEPARRAGRPMEPAAAEVLARASGGYPYAIQLMGRHAWRESTGAATITVEDTEQAVPRAEAELTRGLFVPRWAGLTEQQQEYLSALAAVDAPERAVVLPADVARELRRAPSDLSYMPARLERHGVVYVDVDGGLRFTMPGLAEWVRTRHPRSGQVSASAAPVRGSIRGSALMQRSALSEAADPTPPHEQREHSSGRAAPDGAGPPEDAAPPDR